MTRSDPGASDLHVRGRSHGAAFIERVAPGSMRESMIENRNLIPVQFDHGKDPSIGGKPLGPIEVLREDAIGAYYQVPLLDTDYNRDFVIPVLEGRTIDGRTLGPSNLVGASFIRG